MEEQELCGRENIGPQAAVHQMSTLVMHFQEAPGCMCPDEAREDTWNPFHSQYDSSLKKTKMTQYGGG